MNKQTYETVVMDEIKGECKLMYVNEDCSVIYNKHIVKLRYTLGGYEA